MKSNFILIFFFILFLLNNIYLSPQIKKVIGYSLKNQEINLFQYGKGKDLIILISGLYGNDIKAVQTIFLLKELLDNSKIVVPDSKSLWLIPVVNCDGITKKIVTNENGVWLDRNFDTSNWEQTVIIRNQFLNAGKKAFSEPETIAVKNAFESIDNSFNPVIIDLRSVGNSVSISNFEQKVINLAEFIKESLGFSKIKLNSGTGKLTLWTLEKLDISSVTLYLTEENPINQLEVLLNSFFRISIRDKIYSNTFDNENKIKNLIISLLPQDIGKKVETNGNFKNFFELLTSIKKDSELLIFVNKIYALPASYSPNDLFELDQAVVANGKKVLVRSKIKEDLYQMINDAKSEGVILKAISGYRSYDTQKKIFEQWVNTLGELEAKRVSAKAGESQHQLGTTIDFNSLEFNFANTKEAKWLFSNSYKYGFILSYPENMENITGYRYEPWHYRYIGKNASLLVYKYFNNFLDLFLNWYWDNIGLE